MQTHPWSNEARYAELMRFAEVREAIARAASTYASQATAQAASEAAFDTAVAQAFGPRQVRRVIAAADRAQRFYRWIDTRFRLRFRTRKEHSEVVVSPIGEAIVATLCGLAAQGFSVLAVVDLADGCNLEARLPMNRKTWEGRLRISLRREGVGTCVDAAITIDGQANDWGRSKACLQTLFAALKAPLT